jgi:hypothetical protein
MEIRICPRELRLPTVVRIRDVFFGSRIRLFSIPDPNFFHLIKQLKFGILTKKWFLSSRKYHPGRFSRIRMLTFYPSRIQGSKKHRIQIRNTVTDHFLPVCWIRNCIGTVRHFNTASLCATSKFFSQQLTKL